MEGIVKNTVVLTQRQKSHYVDGSCPKMLSQDGRNYYLAFTACIYFVNDYVTV